MGIGKINRTMYLYSAMGIAVGAIYCLITDAWDNTVAGVLARVYGGSPIEDLGQIFWGLISALPVLLHMSIWGGMMQRDLQTASAYLFPRAQSRFRWFFAKCCDIICSSLLFYIMQFFVFVTWGCLAGKSIDIVLWQFFGVFLLYAFSNIGLVLLINVLSLFGKVYYIFAGMWGIYMLSYFIVGPLSVVADGWAVKLLPVFQGHIALHQVDFLYTLLPEMRAYSLEGFSMIYSATYLVVFYGIALLVAFRFFKKKDLL